MSRYIEADEAKKAVKENYWSHPIVPIAVGHIIDRVPTADAAPVVHAHWIKGQDGDKVFCSACNSYLVGHYESVKKMFKFCFNCGAKMDERGEEDEQIH